MIQTLQADEEIQTLYILFDKKDFRIKEISKKKNFSFNMKFDYFTKTKLYFSVFKDFLNSLICIKNIIYFQNNDPQFFIINIYL